MKIYLDLLPPQIKTEVKRKKIFLQILNQEILFLIPFIILAIILIDTYYVLNLQKKSIQNQDKTSNSQDQYKQFSMYEDAFKQANVNTTTILKIKHSQIYWSGLFEELNGINPAGITVTDFSNKDYQIFLVGKAKSRDDLLNFKDKLEKSNCFKNVDVPLSNLVTKEDVDFQIDFDLNEDCLKEK